MGTHCFTPARAPATFAVALLALAGSACTSNPATGDGGTDAAPRPDVVRDTGPGTDAPPGMDAPPGRDDGPGTDAPSTDTGPGMDAMPPPPDGTTSFCATARCAPGTRCCEALRMCIPATSPCPGDPPSDAGPADAPMGGCRTNADCGPGQYCDGDFDCTRVGTCLALPRGCPRIFDPVCGCDGRTYANACVAHADGVRAASRGECASPPVDAGPAPDAGGRLFCTTALCAPGTVCCESMRACIPSGTRCPCATPCGAGTVCCEVAAVRGAGTCYSPACLGCCM